MLSKRRTECGNQSSDALTVSNDRSGNSLGQNVDAMMMPIGNSTDNLSQVLNSAGLSSSPERPLENDRMYGDLSLPDGGDCAGDVGGLRNVKKLLMHQIRSFIMDPDIDIFSKSQSHSDDSSLKHGVQNNKLNLEMKEVTDLPLENICAADSGILGTEAIISKSQSCSHFNTAVDSGKSEHSNNITTEDWCKRTSESDNNLFEFDISKGKFFGDEREDFESVLPLLLHITGDFDSSILNFYYCLSILKWMIENLWFILTFSN